MNKLQALFTQDIKAEGRLKLIVSERFPDESQKPIEWEIAGITKVRNSELLRQCTKWYPDTQEGYHAIPETDFREYALLLAVECTVFPDLNDAELQASYGVSDAASLLSTMLLPGELERYKERVQEFCGFSPDSYEDGLEKTMSSLLDSGDPDAKLAYDCLFEFHWMPSALMSACPEELAFLNVSMKYMKRERKQKSKKR